MLKKILLGFAALILIFVAIVATRPSEYQVSRSTTIDAPPAEVFAEVNDFHRWTWNPWSKLDPNIQLTYGGPESGVGSTYSWVGNNQVGTGKMTILESRPAELVRIKLEFLKPMPGESLADFTFVPKGNQTLVTWNMSGKNNFISKAICLVMNMDKMIGGQFEKGLAAMKSAVESKKSS